MNQSNKTFWKVVSKKNFWCYQIFWEALHKFPIKPKCDSKNIWMLSRQTIFFESKVILIFLNVKGPSMNYVVSKSAIVTPSLPLSRLFTK